MCNFMVNIIPFSQSQLKSRSLQPVLSKHSPHSLKPCVAEEIPNVTAKSLATASHVSKKVRITHQCPSGPAHCWPPLWPLLCSSRDLLWFQFQSENCVLQRTAGFLHAIEWKGAHNARIYHNQIHVDRK